MTLIQTLLIAALVPIVTFITQGLMNAYRQQRKFSQLKRDSRFKQGVILARIECEGRDAPIFGRCQMITCKKGFYEFKCLTTGQTTSFTGDEVEKLFLIYE